MKNEKWREGLHSKVKICEAEPKLPTQLDIKAAFKMFMAPEIKSSTLRFKIIECAIQVKNDKGDRIGDITGCMGGAWELNMTMPNGDSYGWVFDPREVWFQAMKQLMDAGVEIPKEYII